MLDAMRKNAQSWGIKIVFGLIIVVFVFWGVGSFRGERSSVLAKVDDVVIMIDDFQRAYNQRAGQIRAENPDVTTEDLKRMGLKQEVLRKMLFAQLLLNKAEELGIVISEDRLRQEILSTPAFLNERQQFDPALYQAILRANDLTPGIYEAQLKGDLLLAKMQDFVELPVEIDPEEAADYYRYVREERSIDYLLVDWKEYRDTIEPSQEQIQAYYDGHPEEFTLPPRMAMRYMILSPESLAGQYNATDDEVLAFYENNREQFAHEEQVKARHILIRLDQEATQDQIDKARKRLEQARTELAKGADFAELATEISEGPSGAQGGDLGWFGRGVMVKPFEETVFRLKPGEVSEPVRTVFGMHLIKVEDRRQAGIWPLEEVSDEIRRRMKMERASVELNDHLDHALELLFAGSSLEEASIRIGVPLLETEPFSRNQGPVEVSLDQEQINILFSLQQGQVTESPVLLDEGYLLAEKTEEIPSQVSPLDDVRAQITAILKKQGAMDLASSEAEQLLATLQSGQDLPRSLTERILTTPLFGRSGTVPELGLNPDLVNDVFAAEEQAWLPRSYEMTQGFVLARLKDVKAPPEEQWLQQKSFYVSNLEKARQEQLLQAYLSELQNQARIEIINPEVISD